MDLQKTLTELGNRLVDDFKFQRSKLEGIHHENRTTEPIIKFLIWLNDTPEAKHILEELVHDVNQIDKPIRKSIKELCAKY